MDPHFLSQSNVDMLWEVLMDEDVLKNKPPETVNQINQVFHKNIRPFYDSERKTTNNLMELNKKFMGLIIQFVNKKYMQSQHQHQPQIQVQAQTSQQQVKPTPTFFTHEDIQANRMSQFENEYNAKQQEFKNAMSLPVPEAPKFSDKIDEPLGEMDVVLKRTMAQRNYDIEQMTKNNPNALTPSQIEQFLKPKETSIKNEKMPPNVNIQTTNHNNHNHTERKIKHIKIQENVDNHVLNNEIIEINEPNTYNQNQTQNQNQGEKDNNNNINDEIYKRMQMYDKPPTPNIQLQIQTQIPQKKGTTIQNQNKHITWGPDENIENLNMNDEFDYKSETQKERNNENKNNNDDDDLDLLFKKLKPSKQKLSVEERLDKLESMLSQILQGNMLTNLK